jgi:hypothetical protein
MADFINKSVRTACVPLYLALPQQTNRMILICTLQSHWKVATPETKPRLDHVFPEGLDNYDVASPRHERGTFVYRPVLGEVKADQKLKTEEFWDQTNRARYERAQVDRYRAATAWDP